MQVRSVFLLSLFLSWGCAGATVRPDLRVALLDLDGNFGVVPSGGVVTARADSDALGLGDAETVVQPRVAIDSKDFHFDLWVLSAEYSGDGIATATLDFGVGSPIAINAAVASDVELTLLSGTAVYDILPTDLLDVGLGIGFGYFDYQMDITGKSTGNRVSTDQALPFAFLAGRVAKEIADGVELAARVGWINWNYDNEDLTYFTAEVTAGYRFDQVSVSAGYQIFDVDYEYGDQGGVVSADATFDGPFLSVAIRF